MTSEDVYDEFLDAYTTRMSSMKVGDNFDPSVDQGPQNSRMQFNKILGYIESGKQEGATIHLGGKVADAAGGKGYFIEPTIFTNVKPDMRVQSTVTLHDTHIAIPLVIASPGCDRCLLACQGALSFPSRDHSR